MRDARPGTPQAQSDPDEPADIIRQTDEEVVPVVVDHEYCVPCNRVVMQWDAEVSRDQQDPCGSPEDIRFYTR